MTAPGNTGGNGEGGTGSGTGQEGQQSPAGGQNSGTGNGPQGSEKGSGSQDSGWDALASELGITPDEARKRLAQSQEWEKHAKEWEKRARSNVRQSETLEQTVSRMQQESADRDVKDHERNVATARKGLRGELRGMGMENADIRDLLEMVDVSTLLKDGEPDDDAIEKAAKRLGRVAGRVRPDRDQGAGSGSNGQPAAGGMNDWVRAQVQGRRGN